MTTQPTAAETRFWDRLLDKVGLDLFQYSLVHAKHGKSGVPLLEKVKGGQVNRIESP